MNFYDVDDDKFGIKLMTMMRRQRKSSSHQDWSGGGPPTGV